MNTPFTITQLAQKCGISRTTLLYYEREGLLLPAYRSSNGYRWYKDDQVKRLQSIVSYRSFGVPIAEISKILESNRNVSQTQILKQHFLDLEKEINRLRSQQNAIVEVLKDPSVAKQPTVTKERWVEIMKESGFDEAAMTSWHQNFEKMEPDEHQRFLESLGINEDEIRKIRSL